MAIKTTRLQGKQGVPVQDGSRAPYAHRGRCDKVSRVDRYSKAGEGSVHLPGWYGKKRRVGWQEGLQSRSAGRTGGVSRADRYRREFLTTRPNMPVRQGKQGRPVQVGSRPG